ncbi:hypothetical protein LP416_21770 [Polaromonas sp. P2-4]|nr:hypothetical protein LP416_21770 [Polaromonas sp. P2-4]
MSPSTRRDTTCWAPWWRSAWRSNEEISSGCCIICPFMSLSLCRSGLMARLSKSEGMEFLSIAFERVWQSTTSICHFMPAANIA